MVTLRRREETAMALPNDKKSWGEVDGVLQNIMPRIRDRAGDGSDHRRFGARVAVAKAHSHDRAAAGRHGRRYRRTSDQQ